MKHQIRQGVFETNSSSTHAICISKNNVDKGDLPSYVKFYHGSFGWEFAEYGDISSKASYLYQAICGLCYEDVERKLRYMNNLYSTLSRYGICCKFDTVDEDENGWGYIDHVSDTMEFVEAVMSDEDLLLRYLFGKSKIITGNDNVYDYDEHMRLPNLDDYEVFYKGN